MNAGTARWWGTRMTLGGLKLLLSRARWMMSLERAAEPRGRGADPCGAPLGLRTEGQMTGRLRTEDGPAQADAGPPPRLDSVWHTSPVLRVPQCPTSRRDSLPPWPREQGAGPQHFRRCGPFLHKIHQKSAFAATVV